MKTTEDYAHKLFSTMPSNISTTTAKKKALELVKWREEQLCNSYFLQRIRATKSDAEARRLIRETDEKGNILTYWGGLEEPKQEKSYTEEEIHSIIKMCLRQILI